MTKVLNLSWLPEGRLPQLRAAFPDCEFVDGREPEALDRHLGTATVLYGQPPLNRLAEAVSLQWVQLNSAGVAQDLCPVALQRQLTVTNLAGLYGTSIAQHALALMLILSRNLHTVLRNQLAGRWDRTVAQKMADLHGQTLAVVGLGNIGQNIARLARGCGMRIVGCRRTMKQTPHVDRLYPLAELRTMLAEADYVAVAAPLVASTTGMLGPAEFAAMKKGVIYLNLSRGPVAQEKALLEGLQSGQVAAAGLDVFAVEPLPDGHPFWTMPQVFVSPHYSGETINTSALPSERLARNLRNWLAGQEMEGVVNCELGY